jgi:hypothetical protein
MHVLRGVLTGEQRMSGAAARWESFAEEEAGRRGTLPYTGAGRRYMGSIAPSGPMTTGWPGAGVGEAGEEAEVLEDTVAEGADVMARRGRGARGGWEGCHFVDARGAVAEPMTAESGMFQH